MRAAVSLAAGVLLIAGLVQLSGAGIAGEESTAGAEYDGANRSAPLDTIVYKTWFNDSTRVVFAHDLHAEVIGVSCSECHHAENCRSCHADEPVTALATNSRIALHGVCLRCHEQGASLSDCSLCHKREDDGD
ncbi:MAG: hypothetical protein GF355_00155, partial [Candidatus Eisenbacteria bacterium]|nr:hypothetical protein [Candidatus Eisenbacteria bacterium]